VISYIGLNNLDNAIELLYQLTERDPTNPNHYILRAKLYRTLGAVDYVNIDLQKAVSLHPAHPEIKGLLEYVMVVAIGYKNKASHEILHGRYDFAIYFLNQALELDPTDWILVFKR
jgi:tetratricopeptide (TPR) repeat protein